MVTVRLSEPPALTLETTKLGNGDDFKSVKALSSRNSASSESNAFRAGAEDSTDRDREKRASTVSVVAASSNRSLQDELADGAVESDGGSSSDDQDEVNWEKLQKTEDEQTRDEETDNVGCCLNTSLRHPRHAIVSIHMLITTDSQLLFSSKDSNKRTPSWLRTQRPSKCKLPTNPRPADRARHPWPSYSRWSMNRPLPASATRCCRRLL